VDLRFNVASAEWISQDIRDKILEQVRLLWHITHIQEVTGSVLSQTLVLKQIEVAISFQSHCQTLEPICQSSFSTLSNPGSSGLVL
jgi:hypothetical protein